MDSILAQARIEQARGDLLRARALLEESLLIFRELKHRNGIADRLRDLGYLVRQQGDEEQARSYFEASLQVYEAIGYHDEIVAIRQALTQS